MIEENKQTLLAANALVAAGDYEGFLTYFTEDTVWEFVGDQTLKGKAAVRQYIQATYVEPPKFNVDSLVAEGNTVIAIGKISLKNEAGKLIDYDYCDVWQLSNGKLDSLRAFVSEVK